MKADAKLRKILQSSDKGFQQVSQMIAETASTLGHGGKLLSLSESDLLALCDDIDSKIAALPDNSTIRAVRCVIERCCSDFVRSLPELSEMQN